MIFCVGILLQFEFVIPLHRHRPTCLVFNPQVKMGETKNIAGALLTHKLLTVSPSGREGGRAGPGCPLFVSAAGRGGVGLDWLHRHRHGQNPGVCVELRAAFLWNYVVWDVNIQVIKVRPGPQDNPVLAQIK